MARTDPALSSISRGLIGLAFLLVAGSAEAQQARPEPHIGYLYPAGGQRGTRVLVTAGGQFLGGPIDLHVSGDGVQAKVVKYIRPLGNLQAEQRQLLRQRFQEVRARRLAELGRADPAAPTPRPEAAGKKPPSAPAADTGQRKDGAKADPPPPPEVKLPEHPLLENLDGASLRELAHIISVLFAPRSKQQPNRQLAEWVMIEVAIDPGAKAGPREIRLRTRSGLSNPITFQVGLLPEIRELEPNDQQALAPLPGLPDASPLGLPILLNGQILPGDRDRFRFRAQQGQKLVIESQARTLIPYLADAVPGWFQAALTLYDARGREVAFADDYRFSPDPILYFEVPQSGEYELEIRDGLYRGREDFVYRIGISEEPFITELFPLGGRLRSAAETTASGWNLPPTRLKLDTRKGDEQHQLECAEGMNRFGAISYEVGTLPELRETEPNDDQKQAQRIGLPKLVNGRIDRPGDVDTFKISGSTGDRMVVEVVARRLGSPLDSLVRVLDAGGKVVSWNDDHVVKEEHLYKDVTGLVTHHADSYLMIRLPRGGTYYVQVSDIQQQGGEEYAYRLRLTTPRPDFALRVTPSSHWVRPGGTFPLHVHVLRKDGFDGPIELALKDAPKGFEIQGGHIPAGRDHLRVTLMAPREALEQPVPLILEGRAQIQDRMASHLAVPADDVMQAFLYRHLVPAQELLVAIQQVRWPAPFLRIESGQPIHIPAGRSARVRLGTPGKRGNSFQDVQLELEDPPPGLSLRDVSTARGGITFELVAQKDALEPGFTDNLIIQAFRETEPPPRAGALRQPRRRIPLGCLPAIPIQIVP